MSISGHAYKVSKLCLVRHLIDHEYMLTNDLHIITTAVILMISAGAVPQPSLKNKTAKYSADTKMIIATDDG